MSCLRMCKPGEPVHLVDQGPATPYRNPFATLGGHKVQPVSPVPRSERHREEQRRYVARKRGEV